MIPRSLFRVVWIAAGAALVAALFMACPAPKRSDTGPRIIRFGGANELVSLDFYSTTQRFDRSISLLLSDSLLTLGPDLEINPGLAETWEWSDDARTVTFSLARDRRWHDGQPVTSADVVTTIERFLEHSPYGATYLADTTVEAPDDFTVVVRYADPFAPGEVAWSRIPIFPAHTAMDADPPIGCGPWTFGRWDRGERLVLLANTDHPTPPLADELHIDVIKDYAIRLAALQSGDIDSAGLSPPLWNEMLKDEEFLSEFEIHEYRVLYIWYITWRIDGSNPYFTDARVRQAMSHAINRQGYIDDVSKGSDTIGVTSYHPDMWSTDSTLQPRDYDPQRAAELLDQAGWTDSDGDGVRDKNGVPFRFTLTYQTHAAVDRMSQFIQANLKDVGVDMQLDPVSGAVAVERRSARNYDAMMAGRFLQPDPDQHDFWHSSFAHQDGTNYTGLQDPQIDEWLDRARKVVDRETRTALYRQIQNRLYELEPITVFHYPTSRLAVRKTIRGSSVNPLGVFDFRPGILAWDVQETP